jgi:hypothetical protein
VARGSLTVAAPEGGSAVDAVLLVVSELLIVFQDVRARIQLGGPIVLVWDDARLHLAAGTREFIAAYATGLTVFQPPAHAPALNPQEGN